MHVQCGCCIMWMPPQWTKFLPHLLSLHTLAPSWHRWHKPLLTLTILPSIALISGTCAISSCCASLCIASQIPIGFLVSNDGTQIVGIIDFGDSLYSATVAELAITTAYAILDRDDPLAVAKALIEAYTHKAPLTPQEQPHLHTLTAARLCQSVIMGAYSYSCNPGNEYLLVTAHPGWQALGFLVGMGSEDIAAFNSWAAVV